MGKGKTRKASVSESELPTPTMWRKCVFLTPDVWKLAGSTAL